MGTFESTRYARGHKALKTFELNGEDGSLAFDLHDSQWLSFFEYRTPAGEKTDSHTTGWRKIHVTSFEHPYMDHWWVPGLSIGYEHTFVHAMADFLRGVETGTPAEPTFRTALQTQKVCDADPAVGEVRPVGRDRRCGLRRRSSAAMTGVMAAEPARQSRR